MVGPRAALLIFSLSQAAAPAGASSSSSSRLQQDLQLRCGGGGAAPLLISDARAFGAVGNGLADDTPSIQAAIDAAHQLAEQQASTTRLRPLAAHAPHPSSACAVLSSGIFLSGTVYLRPHVTLYIDSSAVLKSSLNHSKFIVDHDWPGQAAVTTQSNPGGRPWM
jgi:polygalacturonase